MNADTDSIHKAVLPPIAATIASLREQVQKARQAGRTIGFVPTMGALHDGHVSLIEAAKSARTFCVVSIYVNPTQFAPNEDLAAYPRTMNADRAKCGRAGAELIFAPADSEMYPSGEQTRVKPGILADRMCGLFRPGHFEGVCTVVAKLLNIVQPDIAFFGQKDAQQALIIQKMVDDLRIPVQIEVCPIVREADGLAMSSRNAYLSPEERRQALCLFRALTLGRDRLLAGEKDIQSITSSMRDEICRVVHSHGGTVSIDYVEINDAVTLVPRDAPFGRMLLAGAVRIGKTRLIDNMIVDV